MAAGPVTGPGTLGDLDRAGRLLVVSPHLDDAVLSCAGLIRHARDVTVYTVFAADAPPAAPFTQWDRDCGFAPGTNVMEARRQEDARALGHLGASWRWGKELQEGYRSELPTEQDVAQGIADAIAAVDPTHVALPVGIWHTDHLLTARASRSLLGGSAGTSWFFYADQPYAHRKPLALRRRLADERAEGRDLRRLEVPPALRRGDLTALRAYATQLKGLRLSAVRLRLVVQKYWAAARD